MGARRALAPPPDRPRNSSQGEGGAGFGAPGPREAVVWGGRGVRGGEIGLGAGKAELAFTNSKPRIGPSGRPLPGPPAARASPSGGSLRGARPLAPPSITSPALRARLPESCAPRAGGAAQCRASAVRLASASLRPGALAAPLWGRQGAFPAVTIFAKQTKAAPVSERRVPRSTTAQSSKPAAGSRAPRLCPRRLPEASASPGETATGSGRSRAAAWRRRGAHREAGGCVRGRARSRGRRQLCGRRWTALKAPALERPLPGAWRLMPGPQRTSSLGPVQLPAPTAGRDLPAAQAFCGAGVSPAQSLAGRNPSPAAAPAPLRTPAPDSEDDHGPRSLTPITHPASLALPAPGLSSLSIAACSLPHALPGPSPALSTQPRPRGACPVHPDLHWALGETTNPTEPPLEAGDQGPNRNHQHSTARHEPPSHRRHQPLVNKPGAKSTKEHLRGPPRGHPDCREPALHT
ncbi:translation initiation factor IF-2-like [Pteropus medius]|uniref:translation initiation factor IF-2-like n=1 Tax=Pteropus vampyrus TaxID=132908 RepID=UPI00196A4FC4|nr:translation initiation factor IF-2-like [Pteropus giganteus]